MFMVILGLDPSARRVPSCRKSPGGSRGTATLRAVSARGRSIDLNCRHAVSGHHFVLPNAPFRYSGRRTEPRHGCA